MSSRNAFFGKKDIFFDGDIAVKKQIECGLALSVLSLISLFSIS